MTIHFTPIEPVLFDAVEAAQYLRLASGNGESEKAARKALNRLVERGKIRPAVIANKRRYSRVELDRYIAAATEQHGELHP